MKQISVGPSDEEPSTDKKSSSFDATSRFARISSAYAICEADFSFGTESAFLVLASKSFVVIFMPKCAIFEDDPFTR